MGVKGCKPIPGFDGYLATRDGRVWSCKRNHWRKQYKTKYGYMTMSIWDGRGSKSRSVHRLIALAWIPNPENKPWINHKNGNKADNRIENLEWCSASENTQHAMKNGMVCVGSSHPESKLTNDKVRKIRERLQDGATQIALANEYGVSRSCIYKIIAGRSWRHVL